MNDDLLEILTDPISELCQSVFRALECKSFAPFLSDWAFMTVQRALLREKDALVYSSWYSWATGWLSGKDQSEESALKAARSIPFHSYGGSAYLVSMAAAEAAKTHPDVMTLVTRLWKSAMMHDYRAYVRDGGIESYETELEREYLDICFVATEGFFPGVPPREVGKIVEGMKRNVQKWAEIEKASKRNSPFGWLKSLFTGELL
jgi:hypothetical protein